MGFAVAEGANACRADNFSSLLLFFAFAIVMLTYHGVLSLSLTHSPRLCLFRSSSSLRLAFCSAFVCCAKWKKKTFPGGINVISFVSTGRERDDEEEEEVGARTVVGFFRCFYHFASVNWILHALMKRAGESDGRAVNRVDGRGTSLIRLESVFDLRGRPSSVVFSLCPPQSLPGTSSTTRYPPELNRLISLNGYDDGKARLLLSLLSRFFFPSRWINNNNHQAMGKELLLVKSFIFPSNGCCWLFWCLRLYWCSFSLLGSESLSHRFGLKPWAVFFSLSFS